MDDPPLARRGDYFFVFLGHAHVADILASLTPRATILSVPSGSGRCSFKASSDGAVIQVSTLAGVVRITGMAFEWMSPTSAFASVVRNARDRWSSRLPSPSVRTSSWSRCRQSRRGGGSRQGRSKCRSKRTPLSEGGLSLWRTADGFFMASERGRDIQRSSIVTAMPAISSPRRRFCTPVIRVYDALCGAARC